MAEAARLYGELATACVGCHSAHASTRFPGLEGVTIAPPEAPEGADEGGGQDHGGHAH